MSLYAGNVPVNISADGIVRAPVDDGRATWITRDDLADVAVAVLTGAGHTGKAYDVTGPEALTLAQTADILSKAMGRDITYQHRYHTRQTNPHFQRPGPCQ